MTSFRTDRRSRWTRATCRAAALLLLAGSLGSCRAEVDLDEASRRACTIQLRRRVCAPADLPIEECKLATDLDSAGVEYGAGWRRFETLLPRSNPGVGSSAMIEVETPCDPTREVALQVPDGAPSPVLLCNLGGGACPASEATSVECRFSSAREADLGAGHTAASLASDGERLAAVFARATTDPTTSVECPADPPRQTTNLRLQMALLGRDLEVRIPATSVPDLGLRDSLGGVLAPINPDGLLRPLIWSRPWLSDEGVEVLAVTDLDRLGCDGTLQENAGGGLVRIALGPEGPGGRQLCGDVSAFLYSVDVAASADERYASLAVDCNLLARDSIDYFCYGDGLVVHPLSTLATFCNDDLQPQPFPLSAVQALWSDAVVLRERGGTTEVPVAVTSFFSGTQPPTLVVRLYPQLGNIVGELPAFTLAIPQTLIRGSTDGYSAPQPPALVQGRTWGAILHSSRDLGVRATLLESTGGAGVQRSELTVVPVGLTEGSPVPRSATGDENAEPAVSAAGDENSDMPAFAACYIGLGPPPRRSVSAYFWSTDLASRMPVAVTPGMPASTCAAGAAPEGSGARFAVLLAGGEPGQGGPAQLAFDTDILAGGATSPWPVVDGSGKPLTVGRCASRQLVKDGDSLLFQECGTLHLLTLDAAAGQVRAEPMPESWTGSPLLRREPNAPGGSEVVMLWRNDQGALVRTTLEAGRPGAEVLSFVPDAERMAVFSGGQISTRRSTTPGGAASPTDRPSQVLAHVGAADAPPRSVLPRNARPLQDLVIVENEGSDGTLGLPVVGALFEDGQRIALSRLTPSFDTLAPASEYPVQVSLRQMAIRPISDALSLVLVVGPGEDLVVQQVEGIDVGESPASSYRLFSPLGTPRPLDALRGEQGIRSPALVRIGAGLYGASALVRRGGGSDEGGELVRVLIPIDATGQRLGEPLEVGTELLPESVSFSGRGLAAQADGPLTLARETLIRHGDRLISSAIVDGRTRVRQIECDEVPAR